jgi:hypothetical protein
MDLASGLAGLNAALETLRGLRGLEKAYDHAVLKAQIVDLMGHVSDAKLALLEAKEEIQARDAEIGTLKAKLVARAAMVEYQGQHYPTNAEGEPTGLPFCGACLADNGTQVRYNQVLGSFQCPRCRAVASRLHVCS